MSRIEEIDDIDDMDFPMPQADESARELLPTGGDSRFAAPSSSKAHYRQVEDTSEMKNWISVYPIYFDVDVARERGRKVSKEFCVKDPHTRQLAEAVRRIGLGCLYQPDKKHPKSMFNPGRLKVELFSSGRPIRSEIQTRKELLKRIGSILPSINVEKEPELTADDIMQNVPQLPGMPGMPGMPGTPKAAASTAGGSKSKASETSKKQSKSKAKKPKKNLV